MITHEIDLNVSQPNNKQFIHINQGEYDSVKIVAHIWAKNKPYTIDTDKIRIEGKLSSGALLFDGDSAIKIIKENDTTVSFILTKPIAASVGSFNFSLLFYKGSDVLKKTFPFTIRVSGNPANNVKSDAVLDGVIKKLEQQEQEYNQLATVAKTGDYNDLINKPSGLTVTTNLFKPTFSDLISGTKYKILLNSDNTMDVRNNGADFTMIKIGEANVKKGITYKVICYAPDYENLNNTVLSIGGTNVGAQEYYEYIPKADGIIDISIGVTAGNVGTYTIYPMVTPNLAATIDDYVPYTGLYNEINWDVSDLSRGIFQYPMITLHDGNKQGIITYDGTKKSMTLEYFSSDGGGSAGGTADLICGNLTARVTKLSNLTVGNWLPIGKSDIVLKRYDMNDEGETYLTDTISLYDFYTNTSKKFDEIDHSIENLYGTTELYLRKAGDSMTGALRIYVDKIKGSAATGADPIVFAITPEQNTSLFAVTTKIMTRNGNTIFSNYQSSSNTTHINTSNIKFWKSFFAAGTNTDEITLTLPPKTGSLALVEDLPSNYFDTDSIRDANTVLAAPDGVNGKASFRKLVAADIPALDYLPYKNKTISDEVYFANDVFWGNTKKNIQFVYDVDQKFVSFDYFTSGGGGSAGGTANFICNNLSGTEGVFRKDVKIPIYQMDDEGVETLIDTISLKSLYKSCNNLSVNNNTVTIEQFGQQTDSFTLNQNTDVTISLIHDDTKLDVAGGEVSGDLYVVGTLGLGNASEYTYIDYNDNEVSFNKVNNISGKVLGVRGDYFKTANVSVGDDVMLNEYGEMNDEGERPLKRTISLSDLCNRIEKIEAALENLGYMDSNIVSQAISTALDENN